MPLGDQVYEIEPQNKGPHPGLHASLMKIYSTLRGTQLLLQLSTTVGRR